MRELIKPGEAALRPQPHEDYGRLSLDLGVARNNVEIQIHGDYLAKISYDGGTTTTYFKVDQRHAAKIYAKEFKALNRRYARIFLTNTAQAGKTFVLQINELAVSKIEPDVKTLDSSNIQDIKDDLALIETDTGLLVTDVAAIEPDIENIRIYTNGMYGRQGVDGGGDLQKVKEELEFVKTAVQVMDDWDDGADHCETKEYFGGGFYENQVATTASDNTFSEVSVKLRHCVIHNNHATVTSFIGDSVAQRFPIAPGKEITLQWVDLSQISHLRSGGANGTLVVIGSTV